MLDTNVAGAQTSLVSAKKVDKRRTGFFGGSGRARMTRTTRSVGLARRNAGEPNPRPLIAPDGAVAIPHSRWGADKPVLGCASGGAAGRERQAKDWGDKAIVHATSKPRIDIRSIYVLTACLMFQA